MTYQKLVLNIYICNLKNHHAQTFMNLLIYIVSLPLIYFIAIRPLRLLYVFCDVLSFVLYRIIGYRKKVVRDNLIRTGFGENETQRLAIEKAVYKHFCDLYLETFKSLVVSKHDIQSFFVVNNLSLLQNYSFDE